MEEASPTPARAQTTTDCEILNMVTTLNGAIAAVSQDTAKTQRAYDQLRVENIARDRALTDLSEIVKEYGSSPVRMRPQPVLQADVMDGEGNLHAADIGITWENSETFLHGVRVVGPGPPRPTGMGPAMSTLCQPMGGRDRDSTPTTVRPPTSETPEVAPDADTHIRRPPPEIRQKYHPAAPIQRFNNKSLNWPAWFRHFRAVADVHGWNKDQRALQLVSYLDETAMNVAQELGDADLYNYDVLVKLLSDRFDPASRVSHFHGRSRRHHEDADTFADVLAELCHVGYPQSPSELRQELIAEQFVRGQSDPELKKYLWVVIRTQKDIKLQTLIEVCTYFSSLSAPAHIHMPAEQTFAVHQQMDMPYMEDDCDSEAVFAVGDRPPPPPMDKPETTRDAWGAHATTDVYFGSTDGV